MCLDSWEVTEGAHEGFFPATFPSADSLVTKDEKPELSQVQRRELSTAVSLEALLPTHARLTAEI